MEVLIFQKEAFEEMAAKFSRFSDRVNPCQARPTTRPTAMSRGTCSCSRVGRASVTAT